MTKGKVAMVSLSAVVVAAIAYAAWGSYGYRVAATVASSKPVRWWRCQGVDRPLLADGKQRWSLTYSWSGGMGPGNVSVVIDSDGMATLRAHPIGGEDVERQGMLDAPSIARISEAVDKTGLLCQAPRVRDGYVVHDLGRFSVEVKQDTYSKTVYIDECHTLPDTPAMHAVLTEIAGLKSALGEAVDWGPEGTATTPGSCGPGS